MHKKLIGDLDAVKRLSVCLAILFRLPFIHINVAPLGVR
jgi:hypothetical protein